MIRYKQQWINLGDHVGTGYQETHHGLLNFWQYAGTCGDGDNKIFEDTDMNPEILAHYAVS